MLAAGEPDDVTFKATLSWTEDAQHRGGLDIGVAPLTSERLR